MEVIFHACVSYTLPACGLPTGLLTSLLFLTSSYRDVYNEHHPREGLCVLLAFTLSKKCVTLMTTEEEHIALGDAAKELTFGQV